MKWESDLWKKVTDVNILREAIKKYEDKLNNISKEDHLHRDDIESKIIKCKKRIDYLNNNVQSLRMRCPYCFYNHQSDDYFEEDDYDEGICDVKVYCSKCEKDFRVYYDKKYNYFETIIVKEEIEPTFTVLSELGNYIDKGIIFFESIYYSFHGYYYDSGDFVMVNYFCENEFGETEIEEVGRIKGDGVNDIAIKIVQKDETFCIVAYASEEEQKKLNWIAE